MGSVYQRKGRRGWFAWWIDATGRERTKRLTAQTKTEAKRLLLEIERQVERQRLGLEAVQSETTGTLWELCQWWLEHRCPEASRYRETNRLRRYIGEHPIGALPLARVTPAAIDERLYEMSRAGLSPRSVNSVRRVLGTVFRRAIKAEKWHAANPIERVDPREVPKRAYETLRAEEVPLLLAAASPRWRGPFAVAIYTGLRKGEVMGLRRADVDLERRVMIVRWSYDTARTKGRADREIPIAEPLVPYLQAALDEARGDRLFPLDEGSEAKVAGSGVAPEKALRRTLARAGIVDGWLHVCRRCKSRGEPHEERHPDAAIRECPRCGMKLWPKALPRRLRFHDLRHSTATILLRQGVSPAIVQRIMRHASITTTVGTYGHLITEDMRAAVAGLPAAPAPVPANTLPLAGRGKRKPRSA